MASEKKVQLEITKTPDCIKNLSETIEMCVKVVTKLATESGKQIAETIKNDYEKLGYEFKEVECTPETVAIEKSDLTKGGKHEGN